MVIFFKLNNQIKKLTTSKDQGWREIPPLGDIDNILKQMHEPGPVHLSKYKFVADVRLMELT